MKTIINISNVTDYSGETPVITYSNPVTTIVKRPTPQPIITRSYEYFCSCNYACCNCCRSSCCG